MSVSSFLLDPATPHADIVDLVREQWERVQRGEYALAVGLRRLFRDQVHRGAGFGSFKAYAAHRLGIPGKLAELFSFIGSHLERLPRTRAAFEAGAIPYTKVREFVRLATPEDEEEWIAFAKTHTNRELERRVDRAKRGTREDTTKVVSRLDPAARQAVRKARELATKKLDRPVPPDELLGVLAKDAVEGGGLFGSGAASNGKAAKPPRPYLSIHLCPMCLKTYVPTPGEFLKLPTEKWFEELAKGTKPIDLLSDLLCDCSGEKHRRDRCPHAKPTTGPAPTSRHVPAEVMRRIEARDGFRCRTPGCTNEVYLEGGHLTPFRDGAPMDPALICLQCSACNALIETGRLRVEGEAPYERYYLEDGTFLGFGYDPRMASGRDSHVGRNGEPPGEQPGDPEPGRRRRA